MHSVVEDRLSPAREHLIQFGLGEAELLSEGLNNITYPVLSPILS